MRKLPGMKEKWLIKGAELGNSIYQRKLANYYEKNSELSKAIDWRMKAAENGDSYSQRLLGRKYYSGDEEVKKDLKLGFYWMSKSAKQNSCYAQYGMAYFYCVGIGTTPNMEESLKWSVMAYENNSSKTFINSEIIHFLQYYGLLTHLNMHDSNNGSSYDMKKAKSLKECNICSSACEGYYQSTVDGYSSFNVCQECSEVWSLSELEKYKYELRDRMLVKSHFLANFLPLIEYCKDKNQVNNAELNAIILELKDCAIEQF